MKQFALVALLTLCVAGAAHADFMYSFELQTGDTFSFTVPSIITAMTDPLTPAIGISVAGLTIADSVFAPDVNFPGEFCFSFAATGTDAIPCFINREGDATFASFLNPFAVGVYESVFSGNVGGLSFIDTLTITAVPTAIPEPFSVVLLGTVVGVLALGHRRKFLKH